MPVWFKTWTFYVLYALDLLANAIIAGSPCETVSSRCYRLDHIATYRVLEKIVNVIYFPLQGADHCKHAYLKEVLGRQLPYKFYDLAIEMNIQYDKDKLGDKVEIPQ